MPWPHLGKRRAIQFRNHLRELSPRGHKQAAAERSSEMGAQRCWVAPAYKRLQVEVTPSTRNRSRQAQRPGPVPAIRAQTSRKRVPQRQIQLTEVL